MNQYRRHFSVVLAISVICISESVVAQTPIARSEKVVLANGFFEKNEWDDASRAAPGAGIVVYAKQDNVYLYIGIQTKETHTGLDLYLASGAERRWLFHVSSAFADAVYEDGQWSERQWEKNRRWTANKIGLYHDGEKQRSSEPEGFEFQIEKDMIRGENVYIAFHLKRPEYEFPSAEDREAFENWVQFRLAE